jgi:hypothetical protein
LYIYFETTLTAPKVKDLIHCPKQKYKSLFDTINKNLDNNLSPSGASSGAGPGRGGTRTSSSSNLGIDHDEPQQPVYDERINNSSNRNDMKTDLKAFLRGIGLKAKSSAEMSFRPSYETS